MSMSGNFEVSSNFYTPLSQKKPCIRSIYLQDQAQHLPLHVVPRPAPALPVALADVGLQTRLVLVGSGAVRTGDRRALDVLAQDVLLQIASRLGSFPTLYTGKHRAPVGFHLCDVGT